MLASCYSLWFWALLAQGKDSVTASQQAAFFCAAAVAQQQQQPQAGQQGASPDPNAPPGALNWYGAPGYVWPLAVLHAFICPYPMQAFVFQGVGIVTQRGLQL